MEKALLKAVEIKPDYYDYWLGLILSYKKMEDFINEIEACKQLIKLNPDDDIGWEYLGNAY